MSIIQQGRFGTFLRRLFNVKGSFQPELAEEVLPVALVDRWRGSNDALVGVRRVSGAFTVSSGAGTYASVVLFNPSGSNTLIEVERIRPNAFGTAFRAAVAITTSELTTAQARGAVDTRYGHEISTSVGVGRLTSDNPGALPESIVQEILSCSNETPNAESDTPYVLLPGFGIVLEVLDANVPFTGSFRWVERPILAGEQLS